MNIVLNFNTNLSRLFSYYNLTDINMTGFSITSWSISDAGLSSTGATRPTLFFKYSTPPAGYVPRPIEYRADRIDYWATDVAGYTQGQAINNLTANNIQLGCIPDSLLVFIRESNVALQASPTTGLPPAGGPRGVARSDTYAAINNINITFDNLTGQVSTANAQQLYAISKENGLQDTWEQFSGISRNGVTPVYTVGSVVMLKFGKDITLQEGKFPGQVGQFNLQIVVNGRAGIEISQASLYVVAFTPRKLILGPSSTELILGVQPPVIGSGEGGKYMPYHMAKQMSGPAAMFSEPKSALGSIHDFVKKHQLVSKGLSLISHPAAKAASHVARAFGYGEDGGEDGGRVRRARVPRGGAEEDGAEGCSTGGQILSQDDLLSRIKKL
jgi:hypothetical protein